MAHMEATDMANVMSQLNPSKSVSMTYDIAVSTMGMMVMRSISTMERPSNIDAGLLGLCFLIIATPCGE